MLFALPRQLDALKPLVGAALALGLFDAEDLQAEFDVFRSRAPRQQAVGLKAHCQFSTQSVEFGMRIHAGDTDGAH